MKFITKLMATVFSLFFVFSAAACQWTTGNLNNNNFEGGGEINDTRDRSDWVLRERADVSEFSDKVLNIKFYNGGYGRAWLDEMEKKFESEYPGVDIRLTASTNSSDFTTLLEDELKGDPYDIYICHDISWERLGGVEHLLADLTTDLYDAVIYTDPTPEEGESGEIRFRDLLSTSSLSSSYFNGKAYKVAQVQGAGGILYNKTMFDQYGWEKPETYEELVALCEQICEDTNETVAPFLVAGSEGYLWDSLVYDWWIQIAGEDEFNRMLEGNDKNCWNPAKYPYHKQAYEYWYNLFVVNQDRYLLDGFEGIDNIMANAAFTAGLAAMMPATAWAVNEIGADVLEEANIDVGLIPTPYVKEAKKDENGNFIRVSYDVAGRDSIVVAEKGNKSLAIEFLKWMSETENTLIFPKNVSGMLMGFRYDIQAMLNDKETYVKLSWDEDMLRLLGETSFRSTGYSSNPMFILKYVSTYPIENYYLKCFTTYGTASQITPNTVFNTAWAEVDKKWDEWRFQAGLE